MVCIYVCTFQYKDASAQMSDFLVSFEGCSVQKLTQESSSSVWRKPDYS